MCFLLELPALLFVAFVAFVALVALVRFVVLDDLADFFVLLSLVLGLVFRVLLLALLVFFVMAVDFLGRMVSSVSANTKSILLVSKSTRTSRMR